MNQKNLTNGDTEKPHCPSHPMRDSGDKTRRNWAALGRELPGEACATTEKQISGITKDWLVLMTFSLGPFNKWGSVL